MARVGEALLVERIKLVVKRAGKEPKPPESSPIEGREDRLQAFRARNPRLSLTDIEYSAGIHHAEFQRWRRGTEKRPTLGAWSIPAIRIERVLAGQDPAKEKTKNR